MSSAAARAPTLEIRKPQTTKRKNIRHIEESFTTEDTKSTKKTNQEARKRITAIAVASRNRCSPRACRSKTKRRDRHPFVQQYDSDHRFAPTRRFRQAGLYCIDGWNGSRNNS